MTNALLIGCGNIGALYDWDTKDIKTYAKAFYTLGIQFSIYDSNLEKSVEVSKKYGAKILSRWDEVSTDIYDIVVVSSPTHTHFNYLNALLKNPPKLILCEKPVDIDLDRLKKLKVQYQRSNTKVMVNFHRRFQPKMIALAQRVQKIQDKDACQTIVVTYQRGFHNNASHAMDMLGMLFGKFFDASMQAIFNSVSDEFANDPTISIAYNWNGIKVLFIGLAGANFSHFEIIFYFSHHSIQLREGGNVAEFYSVKKAKDTFYQPLESDEVWGDILDNYMINVVNHALSIANTPLLKDNFLESVKISEKILSLSQRGEL